MKRVLVEVTAEDIKNGTKSSPDTCPVAKALNRATGSKWSVSGDYCWDKKGKSGTLTLLPTRVWYFVRGFDRGKVRKPFSFSLDTEELEGA